MQKVLDLLEKHVQWLVLGLGVAFVLYMVYAYVLTPPATAKIAGKEYTSAQVDEAIMTNVAEPLNAKVQRNFPITISVTPFEADFATAIGNGNAKVTVVNHLVPPAKGTGMELAPDGVGPQDGLKDPQFAGGVKLISPPKALLFSKDPTVPGRSMLQQVATAVDPNDPAAMAAMAPENAFINPGMPGGAGMPGANGQPATMDRDWTTSFFKIRMTDLVAAWREAGIVPPAVPAAAQQSLFLEVIGEREEQTGVDAAGQPTWGNRTTLKPLSTVSLLPVPDPAVPAQGQLIFQQWAEQKQGDILQPPFYPVMGGDPWHEPGVVVQPVGGPGMLNDVMPPGMMPGDPNRKQTPEEIRAQRAAEQKQKAEEARQKREAARQEAQQRRQGGAGGRSPGGAGGPPGMPSYQTYDPSRQPYRPGQPGTPTFDPRFGPGSALNPNMRPGAMNNPANPNNPNRPAPAGMFIPSPQQPDVVAWVHDDSVKPGKTYRYRIRYTIKNPVYNTNLAGADVVNVFAIKQDEKQSSDWTPPVSIATRTTFFVAGVQPTKATIRVFRWEAGRLNSNDVTGLQPGDPIGGQVTDANGQVIDYSTGATLVDIRDNGTVIIMNADGPLEIRSFDVDRANPEHLKLQKEIAGNSGTVNSPVGMAR